MTLNTSDGIPSPIYTVGSSDSDSVVSVVVDSDVVDSDGDGSAGGDDDRRRARY